MTATDKRAALMVVANDLQMELARLRAEIAKVLGPVSEKIAALVGAADSLLLASADEISSGDVRKVRRVRSNAAGEIAIEGTPDTPEVRHDGTGRLVASVSPPFDVNVPHAFETLRRRVMAPGKRACSLCRQPGHTARNCPNAHLVREKKVAESLEKAVLGKKKRKQQKPLSEARKAQLREQLKAARAARGTK